MEQQNHLYGQENSNQSMSSIHQKREGFRKEIRSNRLSQDFAARRKIFFREQMAHKFNSYDNQFAILSSWNEVRQQLTSTFMPNYQGLHKFIKQNFEAPIPPDIQEMLIKAVQRADFLTNEHALAILVILTNLKKEGKTIFDSGMIKLIVDNLIKWNVVREEDYNKYEGKVHYFETVCWVLFSLSLICQQNFEETFQTFKENMKAFETHQTKLSYEQIILFASLSIHPSFLPSEQFIRHILQLSLITHSVPSKKILEVAVYLLDNFMRYKYQNERRFESQESFELTMMYMEFILNRLEDMAFGRQQKCLLINLFTTLVKSIDERVLEKIFKNHKIQHLARILFKKAELDEWNSKRASLICILEMICQKFLIPILDKIYNPSNIAYLCYNSLFLPDTQIQALVITAMFILCHTEPNIYSREFRKYNLSAAIDKLYLDTEKNGVKDQQGIELANQLSYVQDIVGRWEEHVGQGAWGIQGQRGGYGLREGDVEI